MTQLGVMNVKGFVCKLPCASKDACIRVSAPYLSFSLIFTEPERLSRLQPSTAVHIFVGSIPGQFNLFSLTLDVCNSLLSIT